MRVRSLDFRTQRESVSRPTFTFENTRERKRWGRGHVSEAPYNVKKGVSYWTPQAIVKLKGSKPPTLMVPF